MGFNPAEPRDPHGRWWHGSQLPWTVTHGTNVTYKGHLGIGRAAMPQLSGTGPDGAYVPSSETLPEFAAHLRDQGIAVTETRLPAASLKPTQTTGDIRAIRSIADHLKSGELPDTKPITVSSDRRVLDGHHNWAGRLLADAEGGRPGLPAGMPVIQASVPITELISQARAFGKTHGIGQRKTGEFANPAYRQPATRTGSSMPDTARALTHEPIGKPGGGVWGMKGKQYPAYFQRIRNDIMQGGTPEGEAHRLAWGILRNFAAGHDGKGNRVSAETQAKAVTAMAEMKKLEAEAHASRSVDELLGRSWNSAAHPRAPAGGPTGGQFSAGQGSGKDTRPTPGNANPVGTGETGKRVSDLQARLNELGAKLKADGKFGPATLAAVKSFQQAHGLKVDGLVGPKTTAALRAKPPVKAPAKATAKRATVVSESPAYDADGLDGSWDDPSGLPDLHGLDTGDLGGEESRPNPLGVARAVPELGKGGRFAKLKAELASKGAKDPGALAAHIGRNRYGKAKFAALAAAARKRKGGGMATAHRYADEGAVLPFNEYRRIWDLEDIHIVRTGQGDSTGRLVEAYAAAFGQRAEIHDQQGHYEEENDPGVFNDELALINRSRAGLASVKCMYNHGLTIHGTPSSTDSVPLGVPQYIAPESRGLLTRTLYLNTPRAEEVLEAVRAGAITAQSYTGRVYRSDPELPGPGARYRKRGGALPLVRRLKLGLKEYGPTPFPAFSGAEILGVRMQLPGGLDVADEDAADDFDETDGEEFVPVNEEDGTGGTPEEVTSPRAHAHSLFAMRTHEAGIAPVKGIWPQ